jgi:hypothetical protein
MQVAVSIAQDKGAATRHFEHPVIKLGSGVSIFGSESDVTPVAKKKYERHI